MEIELGIVVARRIFEHVDGRKVELIIGKPEMFPEGDDYYCPFKVEGIGDEKVRRSGGVDAVQAIILALQRAAMYLNSLDDVKRGDVHWLGTPDLKLSLL